ncbi:hypothetical protein MNBD_NITROSPINAE04-132 [hydrothermal vent metagenome]|uniref:Outer membrane protein H n=1 Tax=hydrothermal vent metagenome TaxID=652676 RepID=A0A3B1CGT6_9ZZZZ
MIENQKTHRIVLIMIAISLAFAVFTKAEAAEIKIGSVNIQSVLNSSEAGKYAVEKLKASMEKEAGVLKSKQEAFKRLEKDFEQQRMVSRPEALEEQERELLKMKRDLEAYSQDTRRMFQRSQTRVTNKIMVEIRQIIKGYAKKNNYTMIVEDSDTPTPYGGFVIYVDDASDITPAIIKIYNDQFKASVSSKKKGK